MKKYVVDGTEFTTIEDAIEEILDNGDLTEEFDEFVYDEHGYRTYLEVCDGDWDTIELLQKLDVYDDMFDDWKTYTKVPALKRDLEAMGIGDHIEVNYCEVDCIDENAQAFAKAYEELATIRTFIENLPSLYGNRQDAIASVNSLNEFIKVMEEKVKEE